MTNAAVAPVELDRVGMGTRWSPRRFARARMDGKPLYECARIAGSKASSQSSLCTQARRWEQHPKVKALLNSAEGALSSAWNEGVLWMRKVLAGEVESTNMDRIAVIGHVGKALGKFIERKEITHNLGKVICRDLTALAGQAEASALPERAGGIEASKVIDVDARACEPSPLPEPIQPARAEIAQHGATGEP